MGKQTVLRTTEYHREDNKHYEGAMTQGNGYFNIRASFEEDLQEENQNEKYWRLPANVTLEKLRNPVSKWGIYVPGIYGKHPILGEELVNLPYFLGVNIYCGGEKFDMSESEYTDYEKTLDMSNGVLSRKLSWKTRTGVNIKITWTRYLSMKFKHSVVQKIDMKADRDTVIKMESFLDGAVTTNGYDHFCEFEAGFNQGLKMSLGLDSNQHVLIRTKMELPGNSEPVYEAEGRRISETYVINLKKNEAVSVKKTGTVVTDADMEAGGLENRLEKSESEIDSCENEFSEHLKIWGAMWDKSEVSISGDDELEFNLRFSIYHLLKAGNIGNKVAVDAKGYAGEAYFGHYFWDTEMYLLPFYTYTQPIQAKKLVEYRYNMLEGAKKNAARYGYRGARYPWESCVSGEEQCPNWQYADFEVHVTADVAYGVLEYCKLTGDEEFLEEAGAEILIETARYWASRVRKKEDGYHLEGVMGPDEYLPFTNDNAYTNYLVSYVLKQTVQVVSGLSDDRRAELKVTDKEMQLIDEIARKLYFPYDREHSFIWQSADFDEYEEVDFDEVWKDRSRPFGTCISQERNYRTKALKQGDTVMLFYLFKQAFSDETKKNCTDYYEKITTHDSSLSYIIHSFVYGDLGECEKSYEYAVKSMNIDWGEKGAAEGIHIANAGGLWQGIVCGFGGLSGIEPDGGPHIEPHLPEHISEISYSVSLRGKWYRITVKKESTEIKECE